MTFDALPKWDDPDISELATKLWKLIPWSVQNWIDLDLCRKGRVNAQGNEANLQLSCATCFAKHATTNEGPKKFKTQKFTGDSLSEALIFAAINQKYYNKIVHIFYNLVFKSPLGWANLFFLFLDAKLSASNKEQPVTTNNLGFFGRFS